MSGVKAVVASLMWIVALAVPQLSAQEPGEVRLLHTVKIRVNGPQPQATNGANQTFLFAAPIRCDSTGTVFLVPAPLDPTGDLRPRDSIIAVGAAGDARRLTVAAEGDGGARGSIVSTAVDRDGRLYVLTRAEISQGTFQQVLMFDKNDGRGAPQPLGNIEPNEMLAERFAVFPSGELLLIGDGPTGAGRRILVADNAGRRIRDVALEQRSGRRVDLPADSRVLVFAESGADGYVYLTTNRSTRMHAIAPSGETMSDLALPLPPRAGLRLIDLRISNRRVAAVYKEDNKPGNWISVHDLWTGDNPATYGPVPNLLGCFAADGGDRFTLFSTEGGEWRLILAEGT